MTTNNQTMSFTYDADGQRVMTTRHDGTILYTPFPDYEVEVTTSGTTTTRTTYRLGGQIVAVQTKVGAAAGTFYFTYTDHLGNIVALSWTGGTFVPNSLARYDPFGNFRTLPATNPGTTNHGFTGHRHNNTGVYPTLNVGLIYMNARYYLPEVGRFISADTIVPDPSNPQSFNRYAYARNSPMNFTDPSGNREMGADENEVLPHHDPPPSPTPIWTDSFLDGGPDWVQPPGLTTYGANEYPGTSGIHTGMDWGKDPGSFTDNPFQFAVRAGCECVVEAVTAPAPEDPYGPWRVDLASTIDEYADFLLIYGHLAEVQVSVGQAVTSDTILGYLEATENHVHVEIRRRSDNTYVNPWPYLAPNLQSQMRDLIDEDTFLPGGRLGYPPFGRY